MEQYIKLIERIIREGVSKKDRTGTGTISIFGHQSTYDLQKGFPLLTAKSTYPKGVIIELLWFIGIHMKDEKYNKLPMTNIKYLVDNKVNIWNEWPHRDMIKFQKETTEKLRLEYPNQTFDGFESISLKEFTDKVKNEEGFAEKWGNLGSVYGKQWRKWQFTELEETENGVKAKMGFIDQLLNAIERLKTHPDDRGNIISAWNVGELDQMALRPCHTMFQFYTQPLTYSERLTIYEKWINTMRGGIDTDDFNTEEKMDERGVPKYKLSLQLYQRSADVFLGVPFNVASYSLLTYMIAQVVNMVPDKFVHTFGDAHIYSNHKSQVNELLQRFYSFNNEKTDFWIQKNALNNLRNSWPALPTLKLNPDIKNIMDFTINDITIENYNPLPKIEAPVAI